MRLHRGEPRTEISAFDNFARNSGRYIKPPTPGLNKSKAAAQAAHKPMDDARIRSKTNTHYSTMNSNEGIVNLETDYLVIGAGAAMVSSSSPSIFADLASFAGFRRRGFVSLQDIHLRDLRPAREARRTLEPRLPSSRCTRVGFTA